MKKRQFLFQAVKCMQAWVQFGVPMEEMGPIFEMLVSNVHVSFSNISSQSQKNNFERTLFDQTTSSQKYQLRISG
jgi:hypothetical protein